jgi:ankyrin repeat protein
MVNSGRIEVLNMQLLRACELGDIDSIIEALASGADIEARKPTTFPPSSSTTREHSEDVDLPGNCELQEIVEFREGEDGQVADVGEDQDPAHVKQPGLTALMQAARGGKAMAVALLLDARATPHARDEIGMQPLHFAASAGCRESCRYLISANACPSVHDEAQRDVYACLPLHCTIGEDDRIDWASLLQVDPDEQDRPEMVSQQTVLVIPL